MTLQFLYSNLVPLLVIGVVVVIAGVYRKSMIAQMEKTYPHSRLDTLAASLNMSIRRGTPDQNLLAGAERRWPSFLLLGIDKRRLDVALEGRRVGMRVGFELVEWRLRIKSQHVAFVDTGSFRCELIVRDAVVSAPFEAWADTPDPHLCVTPTLELPLAETGTTNGISWNVTSPSKEVAQLVGQWMNTLALTRTSHVHVVGERDEVRLHFNQTAFGIVVGELSRSLDSLCALAESLHRRQTIQANA